MGNLQSITDLTRLVQDVQYTAALQGMTPQEKESYFAAQKQELLDGVLEDREGAFEKVLMDAKRNNALQTSLFFYLQRNRDLADLGGSFSKQNERAINTVKYNNQLAGRQYEINEWSYHNKLDTIFVFQLLFITLLIAAGLAYLQKLGFYSQAVLGLLSGILLFVMIAVIVNRALYTNKVRDQRYWHRRQFPKKQLPVVPGGSVCPPSEDTTTGAAAPASQPAPAR